MTNFLAFYTAIVHISISTWEGKVDTRPKESTSLIDEIAASR